MADKHTAPGGIAEAPARLAAVDLERLNRASPEELLAWAADFGERAAIMTSFQKTGCVMIDMAHRAGLGLRVVTVDTLRLHPETYELMAQLEARYHRIERFERSAAPSTHAGPAWRVSLLRQPSQTGALLLIRKVEPTTARSGRSTCGSPASATISPDTAAASGRPHGSKKTAANSLAPLVAWPEEEVDAYLDRYGVPSNPLYDQGYASIGCTICTTPIKPGEDKRAGRWRWFNQYEGDHKKECGIHVDGSGI